MTANVKGVHEQTRLRLTRRGRIVVGVLIALLVAGLFATVTLFGGTQAAASSEAADTEFGYVVVTPGETLWSIATRLDSSTDPREIIAEIVSLNQLESSGVQAGQPVAVPLRYSDAPGVVGASELGLDSAV